MRLVWILSGLAAYIGFTWYSLRQAASPFSKCEGVCLYPLVSPGDVLQMQLHLLVNDAWVPVESCRYNFLPPLSSGLLLDDDKNCSIPIPPSWRERNDRMLKRKAKFRFRVEKDGSINPLIALDIPVDLTRTIEREQSVSKTTRERRKLLESLSSSSSRADTPNITNLSLNNTKTILSFDVDDDIEENSSNLTEDSAPTILWVPHFRYGRGTPIRIRFVTEYRPYPPDNPYRQDGLRLSRFQRKLQYRPLIYVDDKALPSAARIELAEPQQDIAANSTTPQKRGPVLRVQVRALSPTVDAFNRILLHDLWPMVESVLGADSGEMDEMRYFAQDEKLYRFACSQTISLVHMWLDYMAFCNEVRFYRGRQSLKGVSASSVISQLVCSVIILLYLLDGNGTSWVVLVSLASSCAVEAWKVYKLLQPRWIGMVWPFVAIRQLETPEERQAASFDRIAATRLSMVLYPVVALWSLYALQEYTYTSWWSWCIGNLANAVYTFGFISMCPQLYVNYRLQSVAHLPWKVFLYKIFSTFVDDAFAWLVEMPLKHRLMTLRDDVVFLILLYQAYIYRVDKTRTNEYGYSYEECEAEKQVIAGDDNDERSEKTKTD